MNMWDSNEAQKKKYKKIKHHKNQFKKKLFTTEEKTVSNSAEHNIVTLCSEPWQPKKTFL